MDKGARCQVVPQAVPAAGPGSGSRSTISTSSSSRRKGAAVPDSAALENKMEGWEGEIVCLQSTFPLLGVSPTNPCPGEKAERLPVSPLPRGSPERASGRRSHVFWGHCKPSHYRGGGTAFSCWSWCPCGASRRIAPKVRSRTSTPLAGQNSAWQNSVKPADGRQARMSTGNWRNGKSSVRWTSGG